MMDFDERAEKRRLFEDKGLLDRLENLEIEKYTYGETLVVVAPTWKVSTKVCLEDFLDDFDDPTKKDDALRDFACIPVAGLRPFFKYPDILDRNALPSVKCPINDSLNVDEDFHPRVGVNYFIASDLSVSRDATGVAMTHKSHLADGREIIVLDFAIQVKASGKNPVDYEAIREMIRVLNRRGFNIKKLGYDQFQSHDSFVIMQREGYDTEIVKYSDSLAGCGLVYDLVNRRELLYGACNEVFIGEAKELQVINGKRIDHMMSGGVYNSKDVWDAVVNACVLASRDDSQPFEMETL